MRQDPYLYEMLATTQSLPQPYPERRIIMKFAETQKPQEYTPISWEQWNKWRREADKSIKEIRRRIRLGLPPLPREDPWSKFGPTQNGGKR